MAHTSRGVGLALVLSLVVHGLLALALCCVPGPTSRAAFDTSITETSRGVSLSLADLPVVRPSPKAIGSSEEEQDRKEEDFPVTVREPASATGGSDGAPAVVVAPIIVGLPKATGQRVATGTGTAGPGTTSGRRSVLAAPSEARTVVYVVDRSLSMGRNGALGRAKKELLASLAGLSARTTFQVILYNRQAEPLRIDGRSGFLPADDSTRAAVARELDQIVATGSTDHGRALRVGLRLQPDVLFLVTDADDLSDREVQEVTRQNDGRTVLHTIELSRRPGDAEGPLYQLATRNGGSYRRVSPTD